MSPTPRGEAPWVTRARESRLASRPRGQVGPPADDRPRFGTIGDATPLLTRMAARGDAPPTITVADLDAPFSSLTDAERYGLDDSPDTGWINAIRRLTRKVR